MVVDDSGSGESSGDSEWSWLTDHGVDAVAAAVVVVIVEQVTVER